MVWGLLASPLAFLLRTFDHKSVLIVSIPAAVSGKAVVTHGFSCIHHFFAPPSCQEVVGRSAWDTRKKMSLGSWHKTNFVARRAEIGNSSLWASRMNSTREPTPRYSMEVSSGYYVSETTAWPTCP